MVHPFITGHLCPPRIALQHVLPATCCIDLRNALWPVPQVAGILAYCDIIDAHWCDHFANGFRVVFEADLEHQDWAAAQFPPEEEQVHNRLFSCPKARILWIFESFWTGKRLFRWLGRWPLWRRRGGSRKGHEGEWTERERTMESATSAETHVFFCLKC